MARFRSLACLGLLLLTIGFAYLWRQSERQLERMASEVHLSRDAALERRAVGLKAQRDHVPIQKITELVVPITVHFRDRNCVELRSRWGVVGGTEVYCFAEPNQRLIGHQSIGE